MEFVGKILLVEPSRILCQALSLSLFPAYEVQSRERLAEFEAGSMDGYDLVILDRAELRERGDWSPELERRVQSSGIPVLWLEEEDALRQSEIQENATVVRKPLGKEAFLEAVASLLRVPDRGAHAASSSLPVVEGTPEAGTEKFPGEAVNAEAVPCIDLVDAVEEAPAGGQPQNSKRKPD